MLVSTLANAIRPKAATKLGPYHVSQAQGADRLFWAGEDIASGERVDEFTALNFSAAFCAINLISGSIGSMPLITYARTGPNSKDRAPDHPLYPLLHDEPNLEMTSATFVGTLAAHMVSWGNGYAEIERSRRGAPVAFWPLTPDRVHVTRTRRTKAMVYEVTHGGEPNAHLDPADVLHVPGLGFDGGQGYSVLTLARQSLGLGLAAEKFGAAFFGNAARPSGAVEVPEVMSEKARNHLEASFKARRQGAANTGSVMLLEEGATWKSFTIPPEDAQFLETRKFSVVDFARWFNVPVTKLKEMDGSKYATVEYHGIEFLTDTLLPWLVRFEQEFNRKLLSVEERRKYFVAFLVDGILRADFATRMNGYAVAIQSGIYTRNEVRSKENANPVENGDMMTTNAAVVSLDKLARDGEAAAIPPAKKKPETQEEDEEEDDEADAKSALRMKLAEAHAPVIADALGRMLGVARTALARGKDLEVYVKEFAPKLRAALIPAYESLGASVAATMTTGDGWAEFVAERTQALVTIICANLVESQPTDVTERAEFETVAFVIAAEKRQ